MGQIEDLRLFVTIVDQGSIGRAADALGIAKSAVSRRLAQLENRYDMRLIDRQPRTWEVTTAGQELYQRAADMVADADDLDGDFKQTVHSLSGPLKISIAREFGLSFLQPTLFAFMQTHPQINLTVDFDDRTVDLENENYDLGVRIAAGETMGLTCLPLGKTRHGLFASPDYIEQNGMPSALNELPKHALLHYGSARRARWEFVCSGKRQDVTFQPALNSNNGPFLLSAAFANMGIIRLPDFMVRDAVAAGRLVPVLPEVEIEAFTIQVVHRANRRLNKRMRAFVAAVQESCALFGR
ncbi:LysR family transcriptional regulator [Yoonia sediminilitoris]|uniref:LysR family transcriptional regulator n=1 Tax=Yoonia sediminilitoris TaxID=1286148 RepID=A0A2T6KAN9_9RHOB|nr:LysR family transcriptional regulator [Yoonia sediminilitoris]PUB11852.1 LysR family transcriptional regulator [Yoonia sediminilitoris]RCW91929.1 LysR family transcriptional regulator [Yoonia sediminilitoris]